MSVTPNALTRRGMFATLDPRPAGGWPWLTQRRPTLDGMRQRDAR